MATSKKSKTSAKKARLKDLNVKKASNVKGGASGTLSSGWDLKQNKKL